MVPVSMAYAGLAGLAPEAGLVTAFAAMAAYAVLGTSRHLKVTASSAIALMSAAVIATVPAARDPAVFIELSAALALMVGGVLVVAGIARLGFLSQFLAKSVVTGFVIGLAIVITVGQVPGLLGVPGGGATIFQKLTTHRQPAVRDQPLDAGTRGRVAGRSSSGVGGSRRGSRVRWSR